MDKKTTMQVIERLPEFELRDVAVDDGETVWTRQPNHKAVVQKGTAESLAYVSTKYKLVQFAEVLKPIADGIEEFNAHVRQFKGVCVMDVFPEMNEFSDGDTKYGITAINSVDKSTSIVIKFNVEVNGEPVIFPKKLAGFVKPHTGKSFRLTQDYITVITKVKDAWHNIVQHFPEIEIKDEDTVEMVSENFKLNKDHKEYVRTKMTIEQPLNVWEVVELRLQEISERNYKSDVHKSKALERLGNEIFNYALVAGV